MTTMFGHKKTLPSKIQLHLVSPTRYNWSNVAASIIKGCYTPYDEAKAIYIWLAENISYDTSYSIHDSDTAWKSKKGVCQAYCELFYRIGSAVGLDVRIITGHGRGNEDNRKVIEDHCWIVVNKNPSPPRPSPFPEAIIYEEGDEDAANIQITKGLNRSDAILIEPTWGAGIVENGKFVKSDHDMSWFDVDPCWMIFTHYPKNSKDQMLGQYILSANDYKQLPYLHPCYSEYGFEGADLLSYFIQTGSCDFPKIYPGFGQFVEFVDIPIQSKLYKCKAYKIELIKKKECHIAIVNKNDFFMDDDKTSRWTSERKVWSVTFIPKHSGKLTLSIRDENNSSLYFSILEYKV